MHPTGPPKAGFHPMKHPDIQILRTNHLRGPNLWTYREAVEALIDIGPLEDHPSNTLPGFYDRLTAWLPGLVEHHCGLGYRGGFLERLRDGTWPGHIMEHVAIELQNLAGMPTGFGKARQTATRGVYKVVIRTRHGDIGREALEAARDLVMAAINDTPYDVAATVARMTDRVDRLCLGPSTASIVDAAAKVGIPAIRLTDGNLVQLGYGRRQRRIWTAETDRTSAISESISQDKDLTKTLLAACGVPVPEGEIVHSPAEAWSVAQDIGLPVVVKPTDANHARGVSLDLNTQAEIEAAYALADLEGSDVMVERFIRGEEHRILVVGGKMVAATRGERIHVTGDGRSTVEQLIEAQVNTDPRRGDVEGLPLETVRLPENRMVMLELQRQQLEPSSVPAAGREVLIQRTGNMLHDITDEVHPDVAELAALAARVVGLDIAGVDLVAQDITRPLAAQGGAIVEVNAGPGLLMHLKPAAGKPRPVGEAIVDHLFGPSENGRIPVIGVTGGAGRGTVAYLVAWLLQLSGPLTGLSSGLGHYIGTQRVQSGKPSDWEAGQRMLINRNVEAAVIENSPRSMLTEGLAYDRCQISVVTGMPGWDDLDDPYIHNPEQMRLLMRTQVDVVLDTGAAVLNADDEAVAGLAPLCDGEVIFYSTDDAHPELLAHVQAGGRWVTVRGDQIVLLRQNQSQSWLDLNQPALAELLHKGQIDRPTLLAVVATAWALDLAPGLVRACLESCAPQLNTL